MTRKRSRRRSTSQWRYRAEFRIDSNSPSVADGVKQLLERIQTLEDELRQYRASPASAAHPVPSPAADHSTHSASPATRSSALPGFAESLELAFGIHVCNLYFRVQRNAQAIKDSGAESRELRGILRSLDQLAHLFGEHKLECVDPTGQEYHHNRDDIDPIGEAAERADVTVPRVEICERPIVLFQGQVVQRGRATIVCPPAPRSSPESQP